MRAVTFALVGALAVSPFAGAADRTVVLSVPTMDCATCPILIRTALERVEGVKRAQVSYERREAKVLYDDGKTHVAQLVETTRQVGYPSFER